jgi:hypothetical protein
LKRCSNWHNPRRRVAALLPHIDNLMVLGTIGGVAAKKVAPQMPTVFCSVGAPSRSDWWNIDRALLLPPSVQDFVPKDHVSRFNRLAGA